MAAVLMVRTEPTADASFAAIRDRSRLGIAIAAMIKMIATTISNSISENPFWFFFIVSPRSRGSKIVLYSLAGYDLEQRKDDAKISPGVYCADTIGLYLLISADCRPLGRPSRELPTPLGSPRNPKVDTFWLPEVTENGRSQTLKSAIIRDTLDPMFFGVMAEGTIGHLEQLGGAHANASGSLQ